MQRIPPFRTLDALRGFAAIWVVMVHCCDRFLAGNNTQYLSSPLYAFAIQGQLGVMIFFVISGYCIIAAAHGALYSGKTLRRYAFERGRRILPPYWVALTLGTVVAIGVHVAEAHHFIAKINHPQLLSTSPVYWMANLTLTQYEFHTDFANIVFWSLCYEIAFYAVVGLILWFAQRVTRNRGIESGQLALILGLACTAFASLVTLVLFGGVFFPFDRWHQFCIGGLLFYLLESRKETVAGYGPRLRRILNGFAFVLAGLCVTYVVLPHALLANVSDRTNRTHTAACFISCLLLALIKPFDAKIAEGRWLRPLLWVGASSYSLYLIHPVILPFIDVTCRRMGLDGPRYWIAFWIQLIIAIGCGRLFYMAIERHFVSSRQIKRLVEEHAA